MSQLGRGGLCQYRYWLILREGRAELSAGDKGWHGRCAQSPLPPKEVRVGPWLASDAKMESRIDGPMVTDCQPGRQARHEEK